MIETLEQPKEMVAGLNRSNQLPIRVLALVEAETVNGPVKNLLSFYRSCQEMETPCGVADVPGRV